MLRRVKTISGLVAILIVIAAVAGFIDTALNVLLGGPYTYSLWSALSFFARNALVNTIAVGLVALAVSFFVFAYKVIGRRDRRFSPGERSFVFAVSGGAIAYVLVAAPVNFYLLPRFIKPASIIANILLLAAAAGFAVGAYLTARRVYSFFTGKVFAAFIGGGCALAVLISAFGFYAGPEGIPLKRAPDGPNVLIITIDALRRDHVSAYCDDYVQTPNIDRFAARSVVFTDAYANAPWTIPSMYTMLTSRYPSVHGAHREYAGRPDLPTLSRLLADRGYDTEAYIANPIMRPELGFERGFSDYVWYYGVLPLRFVRGTSVYEAIYRVKDKYFPTDSGPSLTPWVTERLEVSLSRKHARPFFIWAHYLDPHGPMTPPREYIEGPPEFADFAFKYGRDVPSKEVREMARDYGKEYTERALYAAEVRYVDDYLARVFRVIEDRGLYANTIIILTADHGEELFEHGRHGHARTHYREVVEVPLVVYVPGRAPGVVSVPVSLLDVMPTVLEFAGVPGPDRISGTDLLALEQGERDVYIDGTVRDPTVKSLRRGRYTLTRRGATGFEYTLIDNAAADGAAEDVTESEPDVLREYRARLDRWADAVEAEAAEGPAPRRAPSEGELRHLKDFGYI